MKDILANYTPLQLKSAWMAERILNAGELTYKPKISLGSPAASLTIEKHKMTHGTYTWTRTELIGNLSIPNDWYQRVYLNGLGKVKYYNSYYLVLDAEPSDFKLKEHLDLPGFSVWKVKLPVFLEANRYNARFEIKEVFMVVCEINDGEDSIAFAGVHPNSAAANVKKVLLNQMQNLMGV